MSTFHQTQPLHSNSSSHSSRQRQIMQPVASEVALPAFFLDHLGRLDETKAFLLEARVDNLTVLNSLLWSKKNDLTP